MNGNTTVHLSKVRRQSFTKFALIAGLFVLGGLCGVGVRTWVGGLKDQHVHLQRCILASKQSQPNEDARSMLTHLKVEVPECMDGAGYEKALDNKSCDPAVWQGDVFCYLPKSYLGKLIHRLEAASARMNIEVASNTQLRAKRQVPEQMPRPTKLGVEAGEP
jgi:hypothetical protein